MDALGRVFEVVVQARHPRAAAGFQRVPRLAVQLGHGARVEPTAAAGPRIDSPCEPSTTGRRTGARFARYSRQFSFSSHATNPKMPGQPLMTTTAGPAPISPANCGSIGHTTLCPTVTTGKCFTGFTCGSISR